MVENKKLADKNLSWVKNRIFLELNVGKMYATQKKKETQKKTQRRKNATQKKRNAEKTQRRKKRNAEKNATGVK